MKPEFKSYNTLPDIAKLQARVFDLEKKVRAQEQTESKLRELQDALDELGIKLKSAQEASGAF